MPAIEESTIITLEQTAKVLEAYQVAVDQLIEDLAFHSGTPREILVERYLLPVAKVIERS